MSRIGNKLINIPDGISVKVDNDFVTVSGSKGELKHKLANGINLKIISNQIKVERRDDSKLQRSLHGTTARVVENMIIGLSEGFSRKLEFKGVGFTVNVADDKLNMRLGYSHPVILDIPKSLTLSVIKSAIIVEGFDKVQVGAFAAKIRETKKPEVYKGKGIRYKEEIIKKKAGKAAQTSSA